MEEIVLISSGSEDDEVTASLKKKNDKHLKQIWAKVKDVIFNSSRGSSGSNFPHQKFFDLSNELQKCFCEISLTSTKTFLWKSLLQWIHAMKLSYDGIKDLKYDDKFNLTLVDLMAQYINYKCKKIKQQITVEQIAATIIDEEINEILINLHILFNGSSTYIVLSLLKVDSDKEYAKILYPIFRKFLSDKHLHQSNEIISYIRLVLCYRHWKKMVPFGDDKEEINAIAQRILPQSVPTIDSVKKPFANISDVIEYARQKGKHGTRILLTNKSFDLEEAIKKYFKQYESYITRGDTISLCRSTKLLSLTDSDSLEPDKQNKENFAKIGETWRPTQRDRDVKRMASSGTSNSQKHLFKPCDNRFKLNNSSRPSKVTNSSIANNINVSKKGKVKNDCKVEDVIELISSDDASEENNTKDSDHVPFCVKPSKNHKIREDKRQPDKSNHTNSPIIVDDDEENVPKRNVLGSKQHKKFRKKLVTRKESAGSDSTSSEDSREKSIVQSNRCKPIRRTVRTVSSDSYESDYDNIDTRKKFGERVLQVNRTLSNVKKPKQPCIQGEVSSTTFPDIHSSANENLSKTYTTYQQTSLEVHSSSNLQDFKNGREVGSGVLQILKTPSPDIREKVFLNAPNPVNLNTITYSEYENLYRNILEAEQNTLTNTVSAPDLNYHRELLPYDYTAIRSCSKNKSEKTSSTTVFDSNVMPESKNENNGKNVLLTENTEHVSEENLKPSKYSFDEQQIKSTSHEDKFIQTENIELRQTSTCSSPNYPLSRSPMAATEPNETNSNSFQSSDKITTTELSSGTSAECNNQEDSAQDIDDSQTQSIAPVCDNKTETAIEMKPQPKEQKVILHDAQTSEMSSDLVAAEHNPEQIIDQKEAVDACEISSRLETTSIRIADSCETMEHHIENDESNERLDMETTISSENLVLLEEDKKEPIEEEDSTKLDDKENQNDIPFKTIEENTYETGEILRKSDECLSDSVSENSSEDREKIEEKPESLSSELEQVTQKETDSGQETVENINSGNTQEDNSIHLPSEEQISDLDNELQSPASQDSEDILNQSDVETYREEAGDKDDMAINTTAQEIAIASEKSLIETRTTTYSITSEVSNQNLFDVSILNNQSTNAGKQSDNISLIKQDDQFSENNTKSIFLALALEGIKQLEQNTFDVGLHVAVEPFSCRSETVVAESTPESSKEDVRNDATKEVAQDNDDKIESIETTKIVEANIAEISEEHVAYENCAEITESELHVPEYCSANEGFDSFIDNNIEMEFIPTHKMESMVVSEEVEVSSEDINSQTDISNDVNDKDDTVEICNEPVSVTAANTISSYCGTKSEDNSSFSQDNIESPIPTNVNTSSQETVDVAGDVNNAIEATEHLNESVTNEMSSKTVDHSVSVIEEVEITDSIVQSPTPELTVTVEDSISETINNVQPEAIQVLRTTVIRQKLSPEKHDEKLEIEVNVDQKCVTSNDSSEIASIESTENSQEEEISDENKENVDQKDEEVDDTQTVEMIYETQDKPDENNSSELSNEEQEQSPISTLEEGVAAESKPIPNEEIEGIAAICIDSGSENNKTECEQCESLDTSKQIPSSIELDKSVDKPPETSSDEQVTESENNHGNLLPTSEAVVSDYADKPLVKEGQSNVDCTVDPCEQPNLSDKPIVEDNLPSNKQKDTVNFDKLPKLEIDSGNLMSNRPAIETLFEKQGNDKLASKLHKIVEKLSSNLAGNNSSYFETRSSKDYLGKLGKIVRQSAPASRRSLFNNNVNEPMTQQTNESISDSVPESYSPKPERKCISTSVITMNDQLNSNLFLRDKKSDMQDKMLLRSPEENYERTPFKLRMKRSLSESANNLENAVNDDKSEISADKTRVIPQTNESCDENHSKASDLNAELKEDKLKTLIEEHIKTFPKLPTQSGLEEKSLHNSKKTEKETFESNKNPIYEPISSDENDTYDEKQSIWMNKLGLTKKGSDNFEKCAFLKEKGRRKKPATIKKIPLDMGATTSAIDSTKRSRDEGVHVKPKTSILNHSLLTNKPEIIGTSSYNLTLLASEAEKLPPIIDAKPEKKVIDLKHLKVKQLSGVNKRKAKPVRSTRSSITKQEKEKIQSNVQNTTDLSKTPPKSALKNPNNKNKKEKRNVTFADSLEGWQHKKLKEFLKLIRESNGRLELTSSLEDKLSDVLDILGKYSKDFEITSSNLCIQNDQLCIDMERDEKNNKKVNKSNKNKKDIEQIVGELIFNSHKKVKPSFQVAPPKIDYAQGMKILKNGTNKNLNLSDQRDIGESEVSEQKSNINFVMQLTKTEQKASKRGRKPKNEKLNKRSVSVTKKAPLICPTKFGRTIEPVDDLLNDENLTDYLLKRQIINNSFIETSMSWNNALNFTKPDESACESTSIVPLVVDDQVRSEESDKTKRLRKDVVFSTGPIVDEEWQKNMLLQKQEPFSSQEIKKSCLEPEVIIEDPIGEVSLVRMKRPTQITYPTHPNSLDEVISKVVRDVCLEQSTKSMSPQSIGQNVTPSIRLDRDELEIIPLNDTIPSIDPPKKPLWHPSKFTNKSKVKVKSSLNQKNVACSQANKLEAHRVDKTSPKPFVLHSPNVQEQPKSSVKVQGTADSDNLFWDVEGNILPLNLSQVRRNEHEPHGDVTSRGSVIIEQPKPKEITPAIDDQIEKECVEGSVGSDKAILETGNPVYATSTINSECNVEEMQQTCPDINTAFKSETPEEMIISEEIDVTESVADISAPEKVTTESEQNQCDNETITVTSCKDEPTTTSVEKLNHINENENKDLNPEEAEMKDIEAETQTKIIDNVDESEFRHEVSEQSCPCTNVEQESKLPEDQKQEDSKPNEFETVKQPSEDNHLIDIHKQEIDTEKVETVMETTESLSVAKEVVLTCEEQKTTDPPADSFKEVQQTSSGTELNLPFKVDVQTEKEQIEAPVEEIIPETPEGSTEKFIEDVNREERKPVSEEVHQGSQIKDMEHNSEEGDTDIATSQSETKPTFETEKEVSAVEPANEMDMCIEKETEEKTGETKLVDSTIQEDSHIEQLTDSTGMRIENESGETAEETKLLDSTIQEDSHIQQITDSMNMEKESQETTGENKLVDSTIQEASPVQQLTDSMDMEKESDETTGEDAEQTDAETKLVGITIQEVSPIQQLTDSMDMCIEKESDETTGEDAEQTDAQTELVDSTIQEDSPIQQLTDSTDLQIEDKLKLAEPTHPQVIIENEPEIQYSKPSEENEHSESKAVTEEPQLSDADKISDNIQKEILVVNEDENLVKDTEIETGQEEICVESDKSSVDAIESVDISKSPDRNFGTDEENSKDTLTENELINKPFPSQIDEKDESPSNNLELEVKTIENDTLVITSKVDEISLNNTAETSLTKETEKIEKADPLISKEVHISCEINSSSETESKLNDQTEPNQNNISILSEELVSADESIILTNIETDVDIKETDDTSKKCEDVHLTKKSTKLKKKKRDADEKLCEENQNETCTSSLGTLAPEVNAEPVIKPIDIHLQPTDEIFSIQLDTMNEGDIEKSSTVGVENDIAKPEDPKKLKKKKKSKRKRHENIDGITTEESVVFKTQQDMKKDTDTMMDSLDIVGEIEVMTGECKDEIDMSTINSESALDIKISEAELEYTTLHSDSKDTDQSTIDNNVEETTTTPAVDSEITLETEDDTKSNERRSPVDDQNQSIEGEHPETVTDEKEPPTTLDESALEVDNKKKDDATDIENSPQKKDDLKVTTTKEDNVDNVMGFSTPKFLYSDEKSYLNKCSNFDSCDLPENLLSIESPSYDSDKMVCKSNEKLRRETSAARQLEMSAVTELYATKECYVKLKKLKQITKTETVTTEEKNNEIVVIDDTKCNKQEDFAIGVTAEKPGIHDEVQIENNTKTEPHSSETSLCFNNAHKKRSRKRTYNTSSEDGEDEDLAHSKPKKQLTKKKVVSEHWENEERLVKKYANILQLKKTFTSALMHFLNTFDRTPSLEVFFVFNKLLVTFIYETLSSEDYSTVSCARTYLHLCSKTKEKQSKNIDEAALDEIEQKYTLLKKKRNEFRSLEKIKSLDEFLQQFKILKKNLFTESWIRKNMINIQKYLHMEPIETHVINSFRDDSNATTLDVKDEIVHQASNCEEDIESKLKTRSSDVTAEAQVDDVKPTDQNEPQIQIQQSDGKDDITNTKIETATKSEEHVSQEPGDNVISKNVSEKHTENDCNVDLDSQAMLQNSEGDINSTINNTMMLLIQMANMETISSENDPFSMATTFSVSSDVHSAFKTSDSIGFDENLDTSQNHGNEDWPDLLFESITEGLNAQKDYSGKKKEDCMISGRYDVRNYFPEASLGAAGVLSPLIENSMTELISLENENMDDSSARSSTDQSVNMNDILKESLLMRGTSSQKSQDNRTDNFSLNAVSPFDILVPLDTNDSISKENSPSLPEENSSMNFNLNTSQDRNLSPLEFVDYAPEVVDRILTSLTLESPIMKSVAPNNMNQDGHKASVSVSKEEPKNIEKSKNNAIDSSHIHVSKNVDQQNSTASLAKSKVCEKRAESEHIPNNNPVLNKIKQFHIPEKDLKEASTSKFCSTSDTYSIANDETTLKKSPNPIKTKITPPKPQVTQITSKLKLHPFPSWKIVSPSKKDHKKEDARTGDNNSTKSSSQANANEKKSSDYSQIKQNKPTNNLLHMPDLELPQNNSAKLQEPQPIVTPTERELIVASQKLPSPFPTIDDTHYICSPFGYSSEVEVEASSPGPIVKKRTLPSSSAEIKQISKKPKLDEVKKMDPFDLLKAEPVNVPLPYSSKNRKPNVRVEGNKHVQVKLSAPVVSVVSAVSAVGSVLSSKPSPPRDNVVISNDDNIKLSGLDQETIKVSSNKTTIQPNIKASTAPVFLVPTAITSTTKHSTSSASASKSRKTYDGLHSFSNSSSKKPEPIKVTPSVTVKISGSSQPHNTSYKVFTYSSSSSKSSHAQNTNLKTQSYGKDQYRNNSQHVVKKPSAEATINLKPQTYVIKNERKSQNNIKHISTTSNKIYIHNSHIRNDNRSESNNSGRYHEKSHKRPSHSDTRRSYQPHHEIAGRNDLSHNSHRESDSSSSKVTPLTVRTAWDYKPISNDEILEHLAKQKKLKTS